MKKPEEKEKKINLTRIQTGLKQRPGQVRSARRSPDSIHNHKMGLFSSRTGQSLPDTLCNFIPSPAHLCICITFLPLFYLPKHKLLRKILGPSQPFQKIHYRSDLGLWPKLFLLYQGFSRIGYLCAKGRGALSDAGALAARVFSSSRTLCHFLA